MKRSIGIAGAGGIAAVGFFCGLLLTGNASASSTSTQPSGIQSSGAFEVQSAAPETSIPGTAGIEITPSDVVGVPDGACEFTVMSAEGGPTLEDAGISVSAGSVGSISGFEGELDGDSTWMSATVDADGNVTFDEGTGADVPEGMVQLPSNVAAEMDPAKGVEALDDAPFPGLCTPVEITGSPADPASGSGGTADNK